MPSRVYNLFLLFFLRRLVLLGETRLGDVITFMSLVHISESLIKWLVLIAHCPAPISLGVTALHCWHFKINFGSLNCSLHLARFLQVDGGCRVLHAAISHFFVGFLSIDVFLTELAERSQALRVIRTVAGLLIYFSSVVSV